MLTEYNNRSSNGRASQQRPCPPTNSCALSLESITKHKNHRSVQTTISLLKVIVNAQHIQHAWTFNPKNKSLLKRSATQSMQVGTQVQLATDESKPTLQQRRRYGEHTRRGQATRLNPFRIKATNPGMNIHDFQASEVSKYRKK